MKRLKRKFNRRAHCRKVGKIGGLKRSWAKTKAAKINGMKGGRPTKDFTVIYIGKKNNLNKD